MALQLRIASPCSEPWDAMVGDARVRRCAACKLNVFNARELTEVELVAMLKAANGGRVCGRLFQRRDGTILTKDCPTGVAALRRRVVAAVTMSVALALTALGVRFGGTQGATTSSGSWFDRVVTTRFIEAREEMRGTRSLGPAINRLWPEDDVTMMRGDIAPPAGPGGP
jgi:hypothetical protein